MLGCGTPMIMISSHSLRLWKLQIAVVLILIACVGCESFSPEEQVAIEKRKLQRAKEQAEAEKGRRWHYP